MSYLFVHFSTCLRFLIVWLDIFHKHDPLDYNYVEDLPYED